MRTKGGGGSDLTLVGRKKGTQWVPPCWEVTKAGGVGVRGDRNHTPCLAD